MPKVPRLPGPRSLASHARTRVTRLPSTARRSCVAALTRASTVPVARPVASLALRRLFDALAEDWERIRADPSYRRGFDEALRRLPKGFRPRRVLDVACGTGIATGAVLDRWPDVNVLGADISPKMVELARQLVPGARFEVASVHDLPHADGEFDLVTALDGLIDPDELLRVLHRKGRLLVVYSKGGTTPISRPLDELSRAFADRGAVAMPHVDGEAHVLVVRHRR